MLCLLNFRRLIMLWNVRKWNSCRDFTPGRCMWCRQKKNYGFRVYIVVKLSGKVHIYYSKTWEKCWFLIIFRLRILWCEVRSSIFVCQHPSVTYGMAKWLRQRTYNQFSVEYVLVQWPLLPEYFNFLSFFI